MPKYDKQTLLSYICPPLDDLLADQLIDEFISQEIRYVLQDWEPATLDGGQFSEIASRIMYHIDSSNLALKKGVDQCLKYIEDPQNNNGHNYPDRKSALHTSKVLRTIYKMRSDRGAIHISPTYTANHVDSKLIIECVRWVLSEILRIFWTGDREVVASAIREIVQYDIPVIGTYEGRLLVLRIDCTAEEEVIILLYHAGVEGLSRKALGVYIPKDPSMITRAIRKLESSDHRQITRLKNKNYRLTERGSTRATKELSDKLIL